MGLRKRLWNWLTTSGSKKNRKGHPDLYPLEVDNLAKELRLLDDAKRLGEKGLPASDAAVLSGPEAAIVQRVEKARQDYVDWATLRLNVLSQDLVRRNVTQEVNRARQADKEFERKASALLTEQDRVIQALAETARKSKEELEVFRTKNGLTRVAHYPSGTQTYLLYAVLFLLVGIEGALNAKFFAQGLEGGLFEGFTEAGIMAAFNVVVAFLLGKFAICYVNHTNTLRKSLGLAALAFSFFVMVCIGLGIAHFRDSLTLEVASPAEAALHAFIEHPLQLRDFFSWTLFGISMGFGTASLFDGLLSDDHYPRYGAISRRTQSVVDDHEDELKTLRIDLEELKNKELEVLDKTLERAQAEVAVFESLIEDKWMAGMRLSTALRDADNSLDALLQTFRTENEFHRNGLQRPAYFDRQPVLKPIKTPDFSKVADEAALREQRLLVNALLDEVQEIRARIQAAFNHHFDRLKPLEIHFPSKELA